jgi:hypothetical protein
MCHTWGRNVSSVLVGRSEGKTPFGRLTLIWEDNIKMDIELIGWVGMNWIRLVQDRYKWQVLVIMAINLCVS